MSAAGTRGTIAGEGLVCLCFPLWIPGTGVVVALLDTPCRDDSAPLGLRPGANNEVARYNAFSLGLCSN